MNRAISATLLGLALTTPSLADSYPIPTDYSIACVSWEDGQLQWTSSPGLLPPPTIRASDEFVAVEAKLPKGTREHTVAVHYRLQADTGDVSQTTFVDPETGAPVEGAVRTPPLKRDASDPLEKLPRNLVSSDGTTFEFDRGNTRHLVATDGGERRVVKELESFPYEVHIADDLAIYSFRGGRGARDKGGWASVYAYNLEREEMSWIFEPSDELPGLDPAGHADVSVDEDRVLVSINQAIFALSLDSGQVIWKRRLPRQDIRRFDSPWTSFGRVDDRLVVQCYEDLFILRREDGKLLWSFDCGRFGRPWPTIRDGRVYVAVRELKVGPE